MSARRAFSAFVVCALSVLVITHLAWAVIGKHRLDEEAKRVYKATRIVLLERTVAPALDVPVETDCAVLRLVCSFARVEAPVRAGRTYSIARGRPCRAPPAA